MTDKPMTVGDVRAAIKDLPDDMPVFMDTDFDCMEVLSINEEIVLDRLGDDREGLDSPSEINALVFGIT